MIKCFLDRLIPYEFILNLKYYIEIFQIKNTKDLLVTNEVYPLLFIRSCIHSDSIINRVDAEEMNAFTYY